MQPDIPVQPGETPVTAALRAFAAAAGWCVTHTTDGGHAKASLHYVGRAVDLADRSGPGWDTEQLLAINEGVLRLMPLTMISELIYAGPHAICVKNGVLLDGQSGRLTALGVYGKAVLDLHHNHVHLGVIPGFSYQGRAAAAPTVRKVVPMYEPPLVLEPIVADLLCPTGGAWLLAASGAVYAFAGAPFLGAPNGKDYFAGRKAARLKLVDNKYQVIAESGEAYGPGF